MNLKNILRDKFLLVFSGFALLTIGSIVNPYFLSVLNFQNLLRYSAIIGTLSIGVTIVFLIKEIDISMGSLLALNTICSVYFADGIYAIFGLNIIGAHQFVECGMALIIVLTIVVGTLVGLLNGLITTKLKISSLITTLGVLYAARGTAFILTGGQAFHFGKLKGFQWLGSSNLVEIPASFLVLLAISVFVAYCLKHTVIGQRIYSIGGNPHAARLSGINVNVWIILALAFSGFCSGIASYMYSSYLASGDPSQGIGYEFSAIATAVLGGTTLEGGKGSIYGTFFAAIVIGLLSNVLELSGVKIFYQNVILGCIIILAVAPTYLSKKSI